MAKVCVQVASGPESYAELERAIDVLVDQMVLAGWDVCGLSISGPLNESENSNE